MPIERSDPSRPTPKTTKRLRPPRARRPGPALPLALALVIALSLAATASQAFDYRTHLGGVLTGGGPIASIDLWPPDRQGRFFDDIRFLSANARYATATEDHRYRALRTGISIAAPPIRGEGSGTGVYESTLHVEIASSAPRAGDRYDPPAFAVEHAFSVPVSWEWSSYDLNGNDIIDYGDFSTTVRVEPIEYVVDLGSYGSLFVEMSADEITCGGPCRGGLGNLFLTWIPVPEPGTAALVGFGLAALSRRPRRSA